MMIGCNNALVLKVYTKIHKYQIHSKSDFVISWMDKKD